MVGKGSTFHTEINGGQWALSPFSFFCLSLSLPFLCDLLWFSLAQNELAAIKCQLQRLQEKHESKVAELSAVLEERDSLLRAGGRRGEGDGVPSGVCEGVETKPGRERRGGGRERGGRRVERLQWKLKAQIRQSNYLRLRLGQPFVGLVRLGRPLQVLSTIASIASLSGSLALTSLVTPSVIIFGRFYSTCTTHRICMVSTTHCYFKHKNCMSNPHHNGPFTIMMSWGKRQALNRIFTWKHHVFVFSCYYIT